MPEHVDAKPIDAAPEPETKDVVHRLLDGGVSPVEVGLLLQEGVIIILPAGLIPLPGRAAEIADPVVRRCSVETRIAPDVPISPGAAPRGAALEEPRVLVRGVIGNEIENDLELAGVGGQKQAVEIRKGAEARIDVAIVSDVVPEIRHGRRIDRRYPNGVDSELDEMIEPSLDTAKVADAIAVRVLKRAGIDLVDDALLPPRSGHAKRALAMWVIRHARSASPEATM